jgi:hypothetical protein
MIAQEFAIVFLGNSDELRWEIFFPSTLSRGFLEMKIL